jgi:hypothetical protein
MKGVRMNLNLKETTSDWFVCGCGNDPRSEGFEACTSAGQYTPPTPKEWDGVHYICNRCETIYNSDTLENVGSAHPLVSLYNKNLAR